MLVFTNLFCQLSGFVFGINNPSSGVFYFSKMEVSTGIFTQLQLMPWGGYNGLASSCIDNDAQVFYYCGGQDIYKIDPLTGAILSTTLISNIGSGKLVAIRYNPCDSMIYGIVNDYPNSIYFARYNPGTGTLANMSALPGNMGFSLGAMSFIDPLNQVYVLHQPGELLGISMITGQVAYNTSIIPIVNESFGHIAYDCATGQIYGTSANSQEGLKYLGVVDPVTGIVTHVGTASWPNGFWKPSNGGDCIDDSSGIYYYSGAPDLLIGVDILTGDTVSVQSTSAGVFLFIQHFSQCPCAATSIEETEMSSISVYPNPTSELLTITQSAETTADSWFVVHDAMGREVRRITLTQTISSISVAELSKGIYYWSVRTDENEIHCAGRFVRE